MNEVWRERPWTRFETAPADAGHDVASAWVKRRVPYKPDANALQTLDLWVPCNSSYVIPEADTFPLRKGNWIIYIHGGAWRDPAITAASFDSTVKHILATQNLVTRVAGIASMSYSLSPHPNHPTDPSPPKDQSQRPDSSRLVEHPAHILDVLTGIAFLQEQAGFGSNYVLIGHSCGATLAFQTVMKSGAWFREFSSKVFEPPTVLVGLNGLYDIPELIKNPGAKHENLVPVYDAFTRLAFGNDESVWHAVSPTSGTAWASDWSLGSKAILSQSLLDSLVPHSQTELMMASLNKSRAEGLEVVEVEISGDHNAVWEDGKRLAEILLHAVDSL